MVTTTGKVQTREVFLSIAIPVYNQAGTIKAAIDSALEALDGQTDVEIVVSENHSTDSTKDVVSAYGKLVKVVRPPFHLSMAANWNYAVNSCSGKWVGMLSGDDKILPGYVQSIRRIVSAVDSPVFAYGGWNVIDARTGRVSKRTVLSMPRVSRSSRTPSSLLLGPKASFASYCFLKAAFVRVGGFPEEYNLVQDWILQYRLSFLGDFVKTNRALAEYLSGQVRDEIEFRRAPLYIEDYVTFCCNDIWRCCDAGLPRARVLHACEVHASRAEDLLNRFPDCRDDGIALISPLYALIGKERVAMNRKAPRQAFFSHAKKKLRSFVQFFS